MSKDSKQWIKDLKEEDFFSLSSQIPVELVEPGNEINKKIDEEIQRTLVIDEYPRQTKGVLPFLRYGIAAAVFIIIASFLIVTFLTGEKIFALTVIKSGPITVIRSGSIIADKRIESYKKGDTLITGETSSHTLRVDESILRLNPGTKITFLQKSKHTIQIILAYGEMLIQTKELRKGQIYEVLTPNATIHFGSCVFITYSEHETTVGLYNGKAHVKRGKTDGKGDTWTLNEGEIITIGETMLPEKTLLSKHLTTYLKHFHEMSERLSVEGRTGIQITTNTSHVNLVIDGRMIQEFNEEILVYLISGEHRIRLEKQGYEAFTHTISLFKNKIFPLDTSRHWKKDTSVKKYIGKSNKLYDYTNPDNPDQSSIIGFAGSDMYVIAVTRTSLICFNSSGSLLWKKPFGREQEILFDSMPYIHERTAYMSSYYKLISIDLMTGHYSLYDAPGMISDGFSMTSFKDWLFIPYPDGLYRIRLDISPGRPEPFITFHNPVQPLVTGEGIYLVSCIFPSLALYSFDGVCKKQRETSSPSVCPPFVHGSFLITGNEDGTINKLHTDLRPIASLNLGQGITWLNDGAGDTFYAFTREGVLYNIHLDDLFIPGKIVIDTKPDSSQYLYKSPVRLDNDLLIGTEDGYIVVIDLTSFKVRDSRSIIDKAISCSIFPVKDAFFTGTKNGKIVRVEYTGK
jgi:hypothetical protein